jgi:hypothetical protein
MTGSPGPLALPDPDLQGHGFMPPYGGCPEELRGGEVREDAWPSANAPSA